MSNKTQIQHHTIYMTNFNSHIAQQLSDDVIANLPELRGNATSQLTQTTGSRPLITNAARKAAHPLILIRLRPFVIRHQTFKALDQFLIICDDIEKVPIMQELPRDYGAALIRLLLFRSLPHRRSVYKVSIPLINGVQSILLKQRIKLFQCLQRCLSPNTAVHLNNRHCMYLFDFGQVCTLY